MPAQDVPVTAAAEVESAMLAPDQEETSPKPDAPMDAPKLEDVKMDAPRSSLQRVKLPG